MALQRSLVLAVAALSIFTATTASPRAEEQLAIFDSESKDGDDDSYWTRSPLYERAKILMKESPLIDTHIDLPQIVRSLGEHTRAHSVDQLIVR